MKNCNTKLTLEIEVDTVSFNYYSLGIMLQNINLDFPDEFL